MAGTYNVFELGNMDSWSQYMAGPLPAPGQQVSLDGKATANVCQNFARDLPTTDPVAMVEQIKRRKDKL